MDKSLLKKIDILFRNAARFSARSNYTLDAGSFGEIDSSPTTTVHLQTEQWKLSNRHVILLSKLYTQLEKKAQLKLIQIIADKAFKDPDPDVRTIASLALIHTGHQEKLVDDLISKFKDLSTTVTDPILEALSEALSYQNHILTTRTVEKLSEWSQASFDGMPSMTAVYDKTNEILLNDFSLQIEAGYNPDINIDEAKVRDAIQQLGLPLDLTESLEHISDLVNNANSPSKYRDAMSAIRAYNERLLEKIAHEIDKNTAIDGKDSKKAVAEFRAKRLISHDVGELLISFRHFLSNDGTHRLKSKQEDARIAKSINIEISLYLLRRLEEVRE